MKVRVFELFEGPAMPLVATALLPCFPSCDFDFKERVGIDDLIVIESEKSTLYI